MTQMKSASQRPSAGSAAAVAAAAGYGKPRRPTFGLLQLVCTLNSLAVVLFGWLWEWTGFRMAADVRHTAFFLPVWLYDVSCALSWPFNTLVTYLTARWPTRDDADFFHDPALSPNRLRGITAAADLQRMRADIVARSPRVLNDVQLMELWDTLPGASEEQMKRNWIGEVVRSGSWLDLADVLVVKPLQRCGLHWGKRYRSTFVGDPLVIHWFDTFHTPAPLWGNVGVPTITVRGKPCATMVYNNQPWHDYFRVLDDGSESGRVVMLGVWCAHERVGGWFSLTSYDELDSASGAVFRLDHLARREASAN